MPYINPYDLLGITPENLSDVDGATINRARKKLLAEIELSDTNTIVHAGFEISKGDCLRVIDDLDDRDKKEFHFFIYQHKHLKRFLTLGKISFFDNYQAESIYKLPDFLDFISQFFSDQYDKVLLDNFKKWNQQAVSKILSIKPITSQAYFDKCFKSTHSFVKELDGEIKSFTKDIENNKSPFILKKFVGLDKAILEKVNVPLLNLLPPYFSNIRNQLAESICDLAVEINNEHEIYEYSYKIIEIANNIETDGLCKQRVKENYYTLKSNYTRDLPKTETPKKETSEIQLLYWWRKKATQIETITKEIEDGESNYISSDFYALYKTIYEIADPTKLNSLSDNFQSVRNRVASKVRLLAIIVNNEPYQKHKVAYDLITIAYNINAEGDVAENVSNAYKTIGRNHANQVAKQITLKSGHDGKSQVETTKRVNAPKSQFFELGVILCLAIGFFFRPVQYFVLGVQLLLLIVTLGYSYESYKNKEISIGKIIRNSLTFIVGAIVGFFNIFVARLFVSYYFFLYSYEHILGYFPEKKKSFQKMKWIPLLFLLLSLIATIACSSSISDNFSSMIDELSNFNSNSLEEKQSTDYSTEPIPIEFKTKNLSRESSKGELNFGKSNTSKVLMIDSSTFENSKMKSTTAPESVKEIKPTDSQNTGEIKF
jgi:hypothetical protein